MCAHYILQIERRNKKVSLMRMTEQKKKEKKKKIARQMHREGKSEES